MLLFKGGVENHNPQKRFYHWVYHILCNFVLDPMLIQIETLDFNLYKLATFVWKRSNNAPSFLQCLATDFFQFLKSKHAEF